MIYNHFTSISEPQGQILGRECCTVPEGCTEWQWLFYYWGKWWILAESFSAKSLLPAQWTMEFFWISAHLTIFAAGTYIKNLLFNPIQPLRQNDPNESTKPFTEPPPLEQLSTHSSAALTRHLRSIQLWISQQEELTATRLYWEW